MAGVTPARVAGGDLRSTEVAWPGGAGEVDPVAARLCDEVQPLTQTTLIRAMSSGDEPASLAEVLTGTTLRRRVALKSADADVLIFAVAADAEAAVAWTLDVVGRRAVVQVRTTAVMHDTGPRLRDAAPTGVGDGRDGH